MPRKSPQNGRGAILPGDGLPNPGSRAKTPQNGSQGRFRLKPPAPLERVEQQALFEYAAVAARRDPRWSLLFAIPNGTAASSIHEAVQGKRTGTKRGVPDVFLPVPARPFAGLFLELKRQNGRKSDLSPEQREWLQRLQDQGYQTVVAFGWQHAAEEISRYLEGGA